MTMNGSRRAFLKSAGATAVVAGLPRSAGAIDQIKRSGGPLMKLSLAAYSFRKDPQRLPAPEFRRGPSRRFARRSGRCRFDDAGGFRRSVRPVWAAGDRAHLVLRSGPAAGQVPAASASPCVPGRSVHLGTAIGNTFTHPAGPDRDREIAYTKLWVDRAADMGAPTIRIFAGDVQKGTTETQARQWCIDAIRECCEYAGRKGVILALENHGGIVTTAEQLVSIVRAIDSEWFGVTWDSGNFRSADPYAELTMIAPYSRHRADQNEDRGTAGRSAADRANLERHQLPRMARARVTRTRRNRRSRCRDTSTSFGGSPPLLRAFDSRVQ